VRRLVDEFRASERRVCGLMEIPRMSCCRYRSRRDDSGLRERLLKLAREKPRFGYWRLWVILTSDERVNHKRVWRVYRDLGLSVKRTRRADRAESGVRRGLRQRCRRKRTQAADLHRGG
jgi:putative transposase